MTVIAVASVHGSPGATSLALDLAHRSGDSLLVEADPDGGCLAARLNLGARPGLTELGGAARTNIDADELWRFAQQTSSGLSVIVAHPAAEQVHAALRAGALHIGAALRRLTCHVIIDVGRVRPGSASHALLAAADHTVIVSHNTVEAIVSLRDRAAILRGVPAPIVVMATSRPYAGTEVEFASGQSVWGTISTRPGRRHVRQREREIDRLLADLLQPSDVSEASA